MAAWNKQWFRAVCKPSNWSADNKPGKDAWCFRFSDYPAFSALPLGETPAEAWSDIIGSFPFTPLLELYSDQVAKTKVLGKIGQKKWDLGVAAGELKQTVGLVTDLADGLTQQVLSLINSRKQIRNQLNQFFRDVRRQGDFYKAAENVGLRDLDLLNTLRDRWMGYQFGVRPLYQDLEDATNWLADYIHNVQGPMLVKAKAGHESVTTKRGKNGCVLSGVEVRPHFREECFTHYSVVYEMPTGQVPLLTQLGLDNPYQVAWELTKLSWMFDYVIGIGDWLGSFTAANGLVFREGCKSVLRRQITTGFQITRHPSWDVDNQLSDPPDLDGSMIERGDFTRTLLTSGVVPGVVPQIKANLDGLQLGNSLFALSNVFSGRGALT